MASDVARWAGAPRGGRGRAVVRSCERRARAKGAKLRSASGAEATEGQGVLMGCVSPAQGSPTFLVNYGSMDV